MDLFTAIDTRASAVRLDAPAPGPEQLDRILRSGVRTPDHGRLSPWRFVVLEGPAREVLGDAMAAALKRKVADCSEALQETERAKARRAPMVIAVAARVDREHKVPEIEQVMAVAAGVQNMMLSATACGYGAMWKTGDAAYDASVKQALGLEATDHIVAFLYLGTPVAQGTAREPSLDGLVKVL
jgi:nitroreductase